MHYQKLVAKICLEPVLYLETASFPIELQLRYVIVQVKIYEKTKENWTKGTPRIIFWRGSMEIRAWISDSISGLCRI